MVVGVAVVSENSTGFVLLTQKQQKCYFIMYLISVLLTADPSANSPSYL